MLENAVLNPWQQVPVRETCGWRERHERLLEGRAHEGSLKMSAECLVCTLVCRCLLDQGFGTLALIRSGSREHAALRL